MTLESAPPAGSRSLMLDEEQERPLAIRFPSSSHTASQRERHQARRAAVGARGHAPRARSRCVGRLRAADERRDWSGYDGPGAAAFHRETLPPPNLPDPLEPVNRGFWGLNDVLIVGIADPVGVIYRP